MGIVTVLRGRDRDGDRDSDREWGSGSGYTMLMARMPRGRL